MGEWDESPEDCPMTPICLAHHTTYNEDNMEDPYDDDEEAANPPAAPSKPTRPKSRIATETRDDLLDTGFCLGESELVGSTTQPTLRASSRLNTGALDAATASRAELLTRRRRSS